MGKVTNTQEMGWYGSCVFDQECQDYYFVNLPTTDRDNLESVVRVRDIGDATGFEKFTAYDYNDVTISSRVAMNKSFDDYFNPNFQKMDCGRAYVVNLIQDSTDLDDTSVTIPDFNLSDGTAFVSNDCSEVVIEPCTHEGYLEISADRNSTSEKQGITVSIDSDQSLTGIFRVPPRDGTSVSYLPTPIRIYLGDNPNLFGIVTYAGTPSNTKLYFIDNGDTCYSGTIQNNSCTMTTA